MRDAENRWSLLSKVPWTAVVAVGGVLGYLAAFLREMGFADCLGIPWTFIRTDLNYVFVAVFAVFLAVFVFVGLFGIVLAIMPWSGLRILMRIIFIGSIGTVIFMAVLKGFVWQALLAVPPVLAGTFCIVATMVAESGPRRSGRRLRRAEPLMLGACIICCLGVLVYMDGSSMANSKTYFFVVDGPNGEMVVLRAWPGELLCASFDRKRKRVFRRFVIFTLPAGAGPEMRLERIGPLEPVLTDEGATPDKAVGAEETPR